MELCHDLPVEHSQNNTEAFSEYFRPKIAIMTRKPSHEDLPYRTGLMYVAKHIQ